MAKRKFSYKDFCDSIAANFPYRVSVKTVNLVWKEAVKYIAKELQQNREVYVPYIGYLYLDEQKGNSHNRIKKFDWVEFKPFKIFLDAINLLDANDEIKLNKFIERSRINDGEFIKQDLDEYADEYVEPYYDDKELATVKEIIKGQRMEDEILNKILKQSYNRPYNPNGSKNTVFVRYKTEDGKMTVFKINDAVRALGISKTKAYEFYWRNFPKCWEDDLKMPFDNVDIWLLGNEEQTRKKGCFENYNLWRK